MSTRDPQSELGTFPHQSSILFVDSFEATWQQRNKLCLSNEAAVLANIYALTLCMMNFHDSFKHHGEVDSTQHLLSENEDLVKGPWTGHTES